MMKILPNKYLDFNNVLIKPNFSLLTSRSQVSLNRSFSFLHSSKKWTGIPIMTANMDTIGTFDVYKVMNKHNMLTALHKFYNVNDFFNFIEENDIENNEETWKNCIISTGIGDYDLKRIQEILQHIPIQWICIDVANGHMKALVDFCNKVRNLYPDKIIIAGNIVSSDMTEKLLVEGKVDICKVGIGSGAACITRMKAGVGVPQLSAILECQERAKELGGFIISDGGITCPGDMSKAFCAGADFVMCGGIFSGHDENPGETLEENGVKYKLFYGMSSEHAMNKHYGKMEKYRSSEGRVLKVKHKGSLENTLLDYMGGLRSCCTYINAENIEQMYNLSQFVQVTQQLNTSLLN